MVRVSSTLQVFLTIIAVFMLCWGITPTPALGKQPDDAQENVATDTATDSSDGKTTDDVEEAKKAKSLYDSAVNKLADCGESAFIGCHDDRSTAEAFMHEAKRLGLDCGIVANADKNKIWNLIEIDGLWYHVDAWEGDKEQDGNPNKWLLLGNDTLVAQDASRSNWISLTTELDMNILTVPSEDYEWPDSGTMSEKVTSDEGMFNDGKDELPEEGSATTRVREGKPEQLDGDLTAKDTKSNDGSTVSTEDSVTLGVLQNEGELSPQGSELDADNNNLKASSAKTSGPSVQYFVHRQTYGWEDDWSRADGQQSGTVGESKRLEGIRVRLGARPVPGSVEYRTHVQTYGWEQGWKADGEMSGTSGESKRLEAIQIRLTGQMAEGYDVWYRVHAQTFGWMGWASNGTSAGTQGYGKRLEAIQIVVLSKGSPAPAVGYQGATQNTEASFRQASSEPSVQYFVHRQTYGWEDDWSRADGQQSGTVGESKRLEGIRVRLGARPVPGSVEYRTHVQTYGWEQGWKADGEMSGTSGESKRLEAIQIRLTGQMAEGYDVWYRVHAQAFGWMGWASNGTSAGTQGYGKRLEAIQIVVLPKGSGSPAADFQGAEQYTNTSFTEIESPMVIVGNRWRVELPEYWRGQTNVKRLGVRGTSWGAFPISTASRFQLLDVAAISDTAFVRSHNSLPTVGSVALKNGQKVDVHMREDGLCSILVNTGDGMYLNVSTYHFQRQQDVLGSRGPTPDELKILANIQTQWKEQYTITSDNGVPITCLSRVAEGISVT